jgi:hypothetical protein
MADRLEQVRTTALANRERTQRGPAVVTLIEPLLDSAEEVGFEPTIPGIQGRPPHAVLIAESGR